MQIKEKKQLQYEHYGLIMQQNHNAIAFLSYVLNEVSPSLILEFGTRTGGLSVLLGLYATNKRGEVYTFDNDVAAHVPMYRSAMDSLGVLFIQDDIYNENVIEQFGSKIKEEKGRCLILCDANKAKEFNIYSNFMKKGDIIGCHDYFPDAEEFQKAKSENIWHYWESNFKELEDSCNKNNLKPYLKETSYFSAWGFFIKE